MNHLSAPIKFKANPVRLVFYAVFFSLMLFLLLPLSRMFQDYVKPKEIVRSIELATPPPPPKQQRKQEDVTVEELVNIESVRTEIEIEPLDVELEASLEGDLKVQISAGEFSVKQGIEGLLADIKMFSLSELDQIPMSLNNPLFKSPKELAEKGITEVRAEALIILTETGSVEFIQFISLSHQEANESMKEYIQKLKYSPPTRNGELGRVRFRLPVTVPISISDEDLQRYINQ